MSTAVFGTGMKAADILYGPKIMRSSGKTKFLATFSVTDGIARCLLDKSNINNAQYNHLSAIAKVLGCEVEDLLE